jgi:hypothetical protein
MGIAVGRIGSAYQLRCSVPLQGEGSPTDFTEILAMARLGDDTIPYQEIVPCPKCCQTYVASLITGSPTVFVNGIAASGIGDLALGITGAFPMVEGSPTVFVA